MLLRKLLARLRAATALLPRGSGQERPIPKQIIDANLQPISSFAQLRTTEASTTMTMDSMDSEEDLTGSDLDELTAMPPRSRRTWISLNIGEEGIRREEAIDAKAAWHRARLQAETAAHDEPGELPLDVDQVQKALLLAGFPVAMGGDGIGRRDADLASALSYAVCAFQTKRGLPVNPSIDHYTRAALGIKGGSGYPVRALQKLLNAKGASLKLDGNFGDDVEAALTAFQTRTELKVDGIAGPDTLAALYTGVDSLQLQRALTSHGFPVLHDGEYGPETITAVQNFQARHNLVVNGIVGAVTAEALGIRGGEGESIKTLQLALNKHRKADRVATVMIDLTTGLFIDPDKHALELFALRASRLAHTDPVTMSPLNQPDGRSSRDAFRAWAQQAQTQGGATFDWLFHNAQGFATPCEVHLERPLAGHRSRLRAVIYDITERVERRAHPHLRITGVFDECTEAAVRDFQQRKELVVDGVVGPRTRELLGFSEDVRQIQRALTIAGFETIHDGEYGAETTDVVAQFQARRQLPPTGLADPATRAALGVVGGQGPLVEALQRALNRKGCHLVVDSVFGCYTEEALKAFQHHNGLVVDGMAGQHTWAALNGEHTHVKPADKDKVQLQRALSACGYRIIHDGVMGPKSKAALEDMQAINNLPVTGLAEPATRDLLGVVGAEGKTTAAVQHALNQDPSVHRALKQELSRRGQKGLRATGRLEVTGVFDELTEVAVKAFQLQQGVMADGIVGRITRNALGLSEAVHRMQRALRAQGYRLASDGILGTETVDALKAYQKGKGLPETGEADLETLAELGLKGGAGDAVRALQWALNREGAVLVVDGVYSLSTEEAVKEFQARNGFVADGVCGPRTAEALGVS